MENDREARIRERAYALWEQEGRPQGDDLRHWVTALEELGGDESTEATITENTSVLGEPTSSDTSSTKALRAPRAAQSKDKKQAKPSRSASARITTGQEDASTGVKHVEGP